MAWFGSKGFAEEAAAALQDRVAELARSSSAAVSVAWANPRFSVVSAEGMAAGKLVSVRERIQRVRGPAGKHLSVEEGLLRHYWPLIRPTLELLETLPSDENTSLATSVSPVTASVEPGARRADTLDGSLPAPAERLVFDDATRTIALDGVTDPAPLDPDVYQLLKGLGAGGRCGTVVSGPDITDLPGLKGKKLARIVAKLPARWKKLFVSRSGSGGGYCLTLPAKSCP